MNYIKQLNAFWNWSMLNEISSAETTLYMAILHCGNISGWKRCLSIPNSTLLNLAAISSCSQLNKLRQKLIKSGLIKYLKGKKGMAGTYMIVYLYDTAGEKTNADNPAAPPKSPPPKPAPQCGRNTDQSSASDTHIPASCDTAPSAPESDMQSRPNTDEKRTTYINKTKQNKNKQNLSPPISLI